MAKRESLVKEVSQVNNEILSNRPKGKLPSEEESSRIIAQMSLLNNRKANLGVFAGKEKKQIEEEIAILEGRLSSLQTKIQREQIDRNLEESKINEPLIAKRDKLNSEIIPITRRINEINTIFQRDPVE